MNEVASHTTAAPAPFVGLEVATLSSDTLRATVRVIGALQLSAAPLLTSVLRTHIASGRRYLRVDLGVASIDDPAVVDTLIAARRFVADLGGMLVFENAGPRVVDAVRRATLRTNASV